MSSFRYIVKPWFGGDNWCHSFAVTDESEERCSFPPEYRLTEFEGGKKLFEDEYLGMMREAIRSDGYFLIECAELLAEGIDIIYKLDGEPSSDEAFLNCIPSSPEYAREFSFLTVEKWVKGKKKMVFEISSEIDSIRVHVYKIKKGNRLPLRILDYYYGEKEPYIGVEEFIR